MRELAEELTGAPEELAAAPVGLDSYAALRQRHRLEARAEEEEELFTRVRLSKVRRTGGRGQPLGGLSAEWRKGGEGGVCVGGR